MTAFTKVVNLRREAYTVYIGRQDHRFHYGNPFSIRQSKFSTTEVASKYEALLAFHDWLKGTRFNAGDPDEVEPERREWILSNIEKLRGESLGCFCKPSECHGDIYRVLLNEISLEEALGSTRPSHSNKKKNAQPDDSQQMGLF